MFPISTHEPVASFAVSVKAKTPRPSQFLTIDCGSSRKDIISHLLDNEQDEMNEGLYKPFLRIQDGALTIPEHGISPSWTSKPRPAGWSILWQ